MKDSNFVYIWKYSVNPAYVEEFLEAYQSDGEWARFFSRDASYIRTELLHDVSDPDVFMTIDYWTSKAARDAFRHANLREFQELDERCEAYTVSEEFIGDLTIHRSAGETGTSA